MRSWLLVLLIAAPACGEDAPVGDDDDDDDDDVTAPDAAAVEDPDARVVATCEGLESQPLNAVWTVQTDDGERSFRVHVPESYDPSTATPLVLNFHGYTSNAMQQEFFSGMIGKSDEAGFIAVHPDGISNSWNAGGGCCGVALSMNIDDVGFVSTMLDELESKLCIDTGRIYVTGMSNGGYMSHRIGCELSDRIAAIAPVAGLNGSPTCDTTRPLPVIDFHGTADTLVPYDQAPVVMQAWAERNGCDAEPETTFHNGDSMCETWGGCDGGVEVVLCTIEGGGHTWPGGAMIPGLGKTTTDLVANDAMWEFFGHYALP